MRPALQRDKIRAGYHKNFIGLGLRGRFRNVNITGLLLAAAAYALAAAPSISGHVSDGAGTPVPNARVFMECGLGSALVETRTDTAGAFRFDNPALGVVGLLAAADGFAFGGATVTVAVADEITGVSIVLRPAREISGKAVDPRGKPIEAARITRALLMGEAKVGVPLAKLKALGYTEPVTDAEGRFTVPMLPEGVSVALKVSHPQFAQAGVTGIAPGAADVKVVMNPGVLVRGQILAREERVPVANAQVVLTRAVAPFDTVLARTSPAGDFLVRLEPGPYVANATSTDYKSPAGEKINVTGEAPEQKLTLYVSHTGTLSGVVADAITGKPVKGAKIVVSANDSTSAHLFTGPTGEFQAEAAVGDNVVTLDSAPGYLAPARPSVKISVSRGQESKLPTYWLATIPSYSIQVLDADMKPVPGAVVTMLRPAQFGWRATDADGRTDLQFGSLPPDGIVVGLVEHVSQPMGAVFALDRAKAKDAKVQLLPLARIEGEVAGRGSKKLSGAVVGAVFAKPPFADTVLLWQTLTNEDGRFAWDAVIPLATLKCVAKTTGRKTEGEKAGESPAVTLEPGGLQDLGRIVIDGGAGAESCLGKSIQWRDNGLIAGSAPPASGPAVLLYCSAEEAPAVVEGLGVAQKLIAARGIVFAAVVNGSYSGKAEVPVFQGARPGPATTYVVAADGNVILETFGLPPLRALQLLGGS